MNAHTKAIADFWRDDHWTTNDRLNEVIWKLSPSVTWQIHEKRMLTKPGKSEPSKRCFREFGVGHHFDLLLSI
ncbi:MAG: hypothetical protein LC114_07340 [Bryobacterales bacterium]|nr:hypothetical protein [Bryobacterales bacterium]